MSTTLRRITLALLTLTLAALAALLSASTASASTGNPSITGGLDHPYLPDAAATVAADPTTGCPLGYFYGDLNGPHVTDYSTVTCEAFQSDYDASAVIFYSTSETTCPAGYQRENAGDGRYFPYFVRCYPFAVYGDPAAVDGYDSTDTAGCAPGYTYTPSGAGDGIGTCFVRSISDAPTPDQCSPSSPCTTDNPPPPSLPVFSPAPSVSLHGSAVGGATLVAAVAHVPSGSTLRYHWRIDGRTISGASRSSFVVPVTYWRHRVSVAVSVSNPNFKSWSGGSSSYYVNEARLANTHRAYLGGVHRHGHRLYAHAGRFYRAGGSYVSGVAVHYQWYLNGHAIRGATHSSIYESSRFRRHHLSVRISGSKSHFRGWVSTSARAYVR